MATGTTTNYLTENQRNTIRRSSTNGVTPTIPITGITPTNDWLVTDLMVGEFFANVNDDKLWWRSDNGLQLIQSGGTGVSEFVDLVDTPSTYTGNQNNYLKVNSGGTGIEFGNINYPTTLIELIDVPSAYTGTYGQILRVNSGETAMEFADVNQTLTGLTDTSITAYTEDNILQSDGNQFVSVNPEDKFVLLNKIQTITGIKTFETGTTFQAGINLKYPLKFSGDTGNFHTITRIVDDLSGGTANGLATVLAIKSYVNNSIYGTGSTDSFVTIDTNQNISGVKIFDGEITFNNNVIFTSTVELNEPIITNPTINGDTYNEIGSYQYMGDEGTDGSWRWFINVDGDLEFQKRESGVWVWKQNLK